MLLWKVHQERDLLQGKAGLQGHVDPSTGRDQKSPSGQLFFVLPCFYWCGLKILVYAHVEKIDPCHSLTLYVRFRS